MPADKNNKSPRVAHPNRGMLYAMLGVALVIIVFLLILYPSIMVGAPDTATIKIPENATHQTVNDSLTKYFGSEYTNNVMRLVKLRNVDFSKRYGAYEIPEGANAFATMRKLTSGAQTPVRLTINGFRSLPLLIERIADKMSVSEDSLYKYIGDPRILSHYGLTPDQALALFIEDTYEIYWSATARDVIRKLGAEHNRFWSEYRVQQAADLGLTPAQVMILASIVDEETNFESEKGTIGRLYINRLSKGMKLQADPTIRFAHQDFTMQRVLKEDLKIESRYNTYLHEGLPPGPIRTINKTTVQHILDSEPNDYLYMCAKEDFSGSHNFASTYEEHMKNALRYQQRLSERGIMH